MCLTLAIDMAELPPVLATDRRHSLMARGTGEQVAWSDRGQKLVRVGAAWLTYTGDSRYEAAVLRALARSTPRERENPWRALRAVLARTPAARYATSFLGASAEGVVHASSDGEFRGPCKGTAWRSLPPGDGAEAVRAVMARFGDSLAHVESSWDLVRCIAAAFAAGARASSWISPGIELAIGEHYLAGDSLTLARMSEEQLAHVLRAAPAAVYDLDGSAMALEAEGSE